MEDQNALKQSCNGYLGQLGRRYKELEELLIDQRNREQVIKKREQLKSLFSIYESKHQEYVSLLTGEAKDEANKSFASHKLNFVECENRIGFWLHDMEPDQVLLTSITAPDDERCSVKAPSSTSSSKRRREAKLKQRLAQQKMEQLKEQQGLERARRELEERLAELQLQGEVKNAELELKMLEEELESDHELDDDDHELDDNDHELENNHELNNVGISNNHDNVVSNVECHDGVIESVVACGDNNINPNRLNVNRPTQGPGSSRTPLENASNPMSELCNMLLLNMNMPKAELVRFDGDPIKYCGFIHSFDVNVACKLNDDKTKLMYLIQYCEGKARECIECCALMPSGEGYIRARKILASQFGQPHVISHARLAKVLNRAQIRPNDGNSLRELAREMSSCRITLEQMGHTANMNSSDSLVKIQGILPVQLQAKWADRANSLLMTGIEPNFAHMTEFVEHQAMVANSLYGRNVGQGAKASNQKAPTKQGSSSRKGTTLSTICTDEKGKENKVKVKRKCPCCAKMHDLESCEDFRSKSCKERSKLVRSNGLCYNCLKPSHLAKNCRRKPLCDKKDCGGKHHTLLHLPREGKAIGAGVSEELEESEKPREPMATNLAASVNRRICLRALPVKVHSQNKEVETWALLDCGSDVSLCDKRLAEKLGLKGDIKRFNLSTVSEENKPMEGKKIQLSVSGTKETEIIELNEVWTVDKLPISAESIPRPCDIQQWSHLRDIDIPQINGEDVMLLIGGDTPDAFWVKDDRRGKKGEPYAMRSILGWTLLGPTSRQRGRRAGFTSNFTRRADELLHEQVEKFWRLECGECHNEADRGLSVEDQRAEKIFEKTVKKIEGHYELGLPWRHPDVDLPDSRKMAETRLNSLKRRLAKDHRMHEKYTETVEGYIQKGYAQEVPDLDESAHVSGKTWYLPHHPVVHPQKEKVRVVFDCAARSRGTSLNDQLLQGPDYNNNLVGVLSRFRQERVALMSDIEAMFHQVKVAPEDRDALRFLWWPMGDLSRTPKIYKMSVHLFGATSSPSCAAFALLKTAKDNESVGLQEAAKVVKENFYVDDCLVSVATKEDAVHLSRDLRELLANGGFRLTKWVCNDYDVIASIPPSERAASVVDLDFEKTPMERTLGVTWDIDADVFTFKVTLKEKPLTRRGILSVTSSLYDPLGFVAPVVLVAKILLQDICVEGLGWDQEVGETEQARWNQWLTGLPNLERLRIPRCLKPKTVAKISSHDMHVFCDASQRGYAAVAYLRTEDEEEGIHCAFIMGKTRLAPVKTTTIPRLELSAAVLGVMLGQTIQKELKLPIESTTYWTDSTSVLQYIRNESRRFHTFVANRISKIRSASDVSQWRFVDTRSNPADEGSRGLSANEITSRARWLEGPLFLWRKPDSWPQRLPLRHTVQELELEGDPEVKRSVKSHCIKGSEKTDGLLERYSSWSRLKKGVAWIRRFMRYLSLRIKSKQGELSTSKTLSLVELQGAELAIIKYIQRKEFPDELNGDKPKFNRTTCSSLGKINPIIVNGVMRVGGRLTNAPVPYDAKHPVILPSRHHVTRLLVIHHHLLVGHSGAGATWTSLRERYWIMKGGATVRHIVGQCFHCKKRNAPRGQQLMADLPKDRVTPDKPAFSNVGIDYFGPLLVRQGRKTVKRYGCIFTCLASRAVHLEIAHTLDTDSFINVLRRFMSRRGRPERIRSDNGTNFKGAERELRENLNDFNQRKVSDFLHQRNIEWIFNTPAASHMGGVWERMIRSVRKILKGVLREQLVDDEVLLTTLVEVEGILNSRPLTGISQDPNDLEPLTPNHLLLMKPPHCIPPGTFKKEDNYCRRRWRQCQYLVDLFWKRWRREYLPLLQTRQKWSHPHRNFQVDDLVLMVDENMPRGQWAIGKVSEVFPGRDGKVRQAEIKVGLKFYKRPVTKLCLLESNEPSAAEDEKGYGLIRCEDTSLSLNPCSIYSIAALLSAFSIGNFVCCRTYM